MFSVSVKFCAFLTLPSFLDVTFGCVNRETMGGSAVLQVLVNLYRIDKSCIQELRFRVFNLPVGLETQLLYHLAMLQLPP
jgi:hypothetical protein